MKMSICNQTTLQMKFTKRQRERFWIEEGELLKLVLENLKNSYRAGLYAHLFERGIPYRYEGVYASHYGHFVVRSTNLKSNN